MSKILDSFNVARAFPAGNANIIIKIIIMSKAILLRGLALVIRQ